MAFAMALRLTLPETRDFIGKAGYALSRANKFDVIVEFFISHEMYDVLEINQVLFAEDMPLLGS